MSDAINQQRKSSGNGRSKILSSVLVPLMIGLLTIAVAVVQLYIASQQRQQDVLLANQTRMKDLEIAEKHHQQALFLASEQQKDTVLYNYLDFLAKFLEKNKHKSSNNPEKVSIVQFKTFAVLDQIDAKRKAHIVRALYMTGLIRFRWSNTEQEEDQTLFIKLNYANLTEVELGTLSQEFVVPFLDGIYLTQCMLARASFRHLRINGAYFGGAQLKYADFRKTIVTSSEDYSAYEVIFDYASLVGARFVEANYQYAFFTGAILDDAQLQRFHCHYCRLRGAKARRADFSSSILNAKSYVS
jgi:uncharacterized protein YjbI with pentapeptide repeats